MISAFGSGLASFLAGQNTCKGREVSPALSLLRIGSQKEEHLLESTLFAQGLLQQLPPAKKLSPVWTERR